MEVTLFETKSHSEFRAFVRDMCGRLARKGLNPFRYLVSGKCYDPETGLPFRYKVGLKNGGWQLLDTRPSLPTAEWLVPVMDPFGQTFVVSLKAAIGFHLSGKARFTYWTRP